MSDLVGNFACSFLPSLLLLSCPLVKYSTTKFVSVHIALQDVFIDFRAKAPGTMSKSVCGLRGGSLGNKKVPFLKRGPSIQWIFSPQVEAHANMELWWKNFSQGFPHIFSCNVSEAWPQNREFKLNNAVAHGQRWSPCTIIEKCAGILNEWGLKWLSWNSRMLLRETKAPSVVFP